MTTSAEAEPRLIAANPVPPQAAKPEAAWSSTSLLERIDARSEDMHTQDKPTIKLPERARPPVSRRLVAGLAGAAVAITALIVAIALFGDDQPTSDYAEAAAAGDAPAVLGAFVDSYRIGDVETALTYVHPDMTITAIARHPGFEWLPGLIEFEGVLYGRADPGPSTCEGPNASGFVVCTYTESSDSVLRAVGFPEVTWVAQVVDGRIANLQFPGLLEGDVILQRVRDVVDRPLGDFVREIDPEGLATQCDQLAAFEANINLFSPVVFNEQCATFLVGFLDDFVATQNP